MIDGLRSLLREPLVYFVLIGATVFALDAALRRDADTIRITPAVREGITQTLQVRLGRAPTADEVQTDLERWKEQQALYREAVKMGLRDDDPVVIGEMASKLLQIAREREVLPEPSEAELRAFLERHRSEYTVPASYDVDLVFVAQTPGDARARVDEVLARLRAGASPEGLGDWFPRGHRFTGVSAQDAALLFGEDAAKALPTFAPGEWNVVAGIRGYYALRVTGVDHGEPVFEKLRGALVFAWQADRREQAAMAFAQRVEARYRFVMSQ